MKKLIRGINTLIILVAAGATMYAQINLSGKKIHELPSLPSNVVDTNYLFIIANPIDGKPYKFKKNALLSGATGVVDGNYGDISVSGVSWSINASSVQNSKLATMANNTFKGNVSGSTSVPQDLSVGQMQSALGVNNKLNASDTAYLSNRINSKMTYADTASLSNRINNKQDADADLTSISGASGTNTIYYRSAANTWSPVTIGGNMTFSSGTLNSTAGGGGTWGSITGTIGNQTDLAYELSQKQAQLVSSSNIKTINNISILGSGNISVGDGGSQTLDQTLAVGNTTDTSIVFDPNTYATNYEFIKVNPIDTFSSQIPFRIIRNNTPQNGGAVAGNEVVIIGFNISGGGGVIESGKPALGESWESNYLPDFSSRWLEKHEIYIPSVTANGLTAGNQVRLSSYTIKTTDNSIDYYKTVDAFSLNSPGSNNNYFSTGANRADSSSSIALRALNNSSVFTFLNNGSNNILYLSAGNNSTTSRFQLQNIEEMSFDNSNIIEVNSISLNTIIARGSYINIQSPFNITRAGSVSTLNLAYGSANENNMLSLSADGGSGEIKYLVKDGGYYPTFYSNGNEAFRVHTSGNMLIGTTTNVVSAIVTMESTTKGFLPPRMTTSQVNAISSPAEGLQAYDNTIHEPKYYNGTTWKTYGGSQTLDQTLAVGNVSDTGIVFDPNTYATNYEFIKVNPIDTFSSQVPFRMIRWNVPQNSGAVAGNEGLMFGFNLGSGGGVIESGKPAIGFSIETNYLPDYSTRYVEWHDLYIPSVTSGGLTAGNQVRLQSYTINTATNSIDLYRRVGREYLMVPSSDVQYWSVQPGGFSLKNTDGTQGVSHDVDANRYTITATGADTTMSIAGFDFINFGNAYLQDFILPVGLSLNNPTITNTLHINTSTRIKHPGDLSKYILFDPQAGNNALAIYGGGLNNIILYSISEFRMDHTGGNEMSVTSGGVRFGGAGNKSIYGEDLTLKLGLSSSYRFSQAWVKDGHFDQIAFHSKASNPTTSDIEAGNWMVWKNTTTGETYMYMNDGGTMKRSAIFATF